MPTVTDHIDKSVLSQSGESLKLIANFGNGVDNIDVATAVQRGITVTNTPGVLTEDTADMTMALILAVPRRLAEGAQVLIGDREWGGWSPTWMLGHRIWGKRLGIVGMGRIGQAVARRAQAFGLKIHYHDRRRVAPEIEEELHATYWESLDQMLARMDIISINCPHTPATYHLLSARRLKLIRPEAYIVNTARGEVIDENALARLIESRRDRRRRPRRVRARAGGEPEARQAGARRQGRAAAASRLGHGRRPRRHGREGHRQHQDLPRRSSPAGPRPAVDVVSSNVVMDLACRSTERCRMLHILPRRFCASRAASLRVSSLPSRRARRRIRQITPAEALGAASQGVLAHDGMVVAQEARAARIGVDILAKGRQCGGCRGRGRLSRWPSAIRAPAISAAAASW